MWKKTFLIIGLIALIVADVNAQRMTIGPQLGYYNARGTDNWAYMIGVTWRLKLNKVLGVEASINNHQENYANNTVTVRSWPVMVSYLIYPLPPVVYGVIGIGWYSLTYDYNQSRFPLLTDEVAQKVGWHVGGGLELPIGPSVKLNGDIRYVFLNYDFQAFPGSDDLKSNFIVITAGFLLDL
jgi:opacity protein-like surface antigen